MKYWGVYNSPTKLIPHEIGWGSYFLEGRMHGKPPVIGRIISPLTTRMPREADRIQFLLWAGRTSFHSHTTVFVFLTPENLGCRQILTFYIFPFIIWVCVVIFLHVGSVLIILRRLGKSLLFSP